MADLLTAANLLRPDDWDGYIGQEHMKMQMHIHIQSALKRQEPLGHIFLSGPPGCGKGHPLDTLILSPEGWVKLADLHVGSVITGADGRPTTVTGVYDRGELDTYLVTFSDGATTVCDGDHLWRVSESHGRAYVRSTTELQGKLERAGRYLWRIPVVQPVQHTPTPLPVEPYLLGVLLANGHLFGTPSISTDDTAIIERIKSRSNVDLHFVTSESSTAGRWTVQNFRDPLRSLGIYELLSGDKFIPSQYLTADEDARRELLAGLMDCDGSYAQNDKTGAVYHTTSTTLAAQVLTLIRSLGGLGTYSSRASSKVRSGFECRVFFQMPTNPFRSPKKAAHFRVGTPSRRIVSIEPYGRSQIRCIQVDAEDKLYVTEDYVVTHNTTFGQIVANTLRVPYYHFESPLTTEDYRSMRSAYGVIHVDEVHNEVKFGQEQLRTATEQGYMKPKGMGRIEWDAITFILSTTDPGKVIRPLVERCVYRPFFEEYSDDEMAAIGMGMADRLGIRLADQDYMILGRAAAGTPRRVSWFMTSARDLVEVTGQVPSAREVLEFMRYTEEGLTPQHIQYMTLLERQSPIGLDALREWCEMDTAGIRELERLLMKLGYIEKGNRGRELSTVGYRRIKELMKEDS